MKVLEIWRYPVKTMAGEKLAHAHLGSLGIDGDRIVHVEDARGKREAKLADYEQKRQELAARNQQEIEKYQQWKAKIDQREASKAE